MIMRVQIDIFCEKIYNHIMEIYEYKEKFKIKYCDTDFKDELKPSIALSLMEEAACASAEGLNFGYKYLKPKGFAFMVTNICCEFIKPILLGDNVYVKTWPLKPSHVIFGREYRFVDEHDEILMNASSRWCLIDMNTGKILPSKVIDNQDYSTYNPTKVFENVQWKIPLFQREEGDLKFSITIANSEYDHNMHVNNTKYADYCFNCFTVNELANKKLKRFSISYVKQCKEGDTLSFYLKESEELGLYYIQGYNHLQELVVQASVTFE